MSAITAKIVAIAPAGALALSNAVRAVPRRAQIIGKLNPRSATPAISKSPPQRWSWAWRTGKLVAASAVTVPSAMVIIPRIKNTVASVCEICRSVIRQSSKDSVSLLFGALILRDRALS